MARLVKQFPRQESKYSRLSKIMSKCYDGRAYELKYRQDFSEPPAKIGAILHKLAIKAGYNISVTTNGKDTFVIQARYRQVPHRYYTDGYKSVEIRPR